MITDNLDLKPSDGLVSINDREPTPLEKRLIDGEQISYFELCAVYLQIENLIEEEKIIRKLDECAIASRFANVKRISEVSENLINMIKKHGFVNSLIHISNFSIELMYLVSDCDSFECLNYKTNRTVFNLLSEEIEKDLVCDFIEINEDTKDELRMRYSENDDEIDVDALLDAVSKASCVKKTKTDNGIDLDKLLGGSEEKSITERAIELGGRRVHDDWIHQQLMSATSMDEKIGPITDEGWCDGWWAQQKHLFKLRDKLSDWHTYNDKDDDNFADPLYQINKAIERLLAHNKLLQFELDKLK